MAGRVRKGKKNTAAEEAVNPFYFALCLIIEVYLALIVCVYPLLIRAGYAVTSRIKYNFLTGISYGFFFDSVPVPTFLPVAVLLAVPGWSKQIRDRKMRAADFVRGYHLSLTDKFVLLYALSLVLSSLLCANKAELWWGYTGWNMGLASQILFVCLYFMMSRFFDPEDLRFFTYAAMIVSSVVFIIGFLQRLGMDVFDLYAGLENKRGYVSTIGQATWYSSYLMIFVAAGIFLVWYMDSSALLYKAGLLYLVTGSLSLVTQNSDSAYAGLFLALSLLFVWSFDSAKQMKRFLETSLVILLSFRVAGVAYGIAGEKAVQLDKLSVFMMQSPWIWLLIAILACCYIPVRKLQNKKNGFDDGRYRVFGTVYAAALVLTVALLALYIVLNTRGVLPEAYSSSSNYLFFDRRWGSYRGAWLMDTAASFFALLKEEPLKALFGAGADQFYYVLQTYIPERAQAKEVLTNAHNEWLTQFINFGLLGGTAYLGIFLSCIAGAAKYRKQTPYAMCAAVCVIAYMAHNLFCYQQYICTPYIFIIMGIGEKMIRTYRVSIKKQDG